MAKFYKTHFDILALIGSLIIASITRIALPFSMVFQNGRVIFNSVDAYYQLRFADLISAHFPRTNFYDPYLNTQMGFTPLFNLLLAWLGRIFGNLDAVAAYLPAVLGVLTLIPIFIIAKKVFNNQWIASFAVFFAAILPGLFYNRTQLGAADYHCLEIFLSTIMMMWIVLALKEGYIWLKICYGSLAVCTYCFYSWAWMGSVVFIGILAVFLYVWAGLSWAKKHPSIKYNAILHGFVIAVILGIIIYSFIYESNHFQSLIKSGVGIFGWDLKSGSSEELPLLFMGQASGSGNMLDLRTVWGYFGFLFFFALTGFGMLIYRVLKHRQPAEIILLVWSVVILMLTLAMRRWAYYLAVNVAILSAYSCYVIGEALIYIKGKIQVRTTIIIAALLIGLVFVALIRNDVGMARNPQNYMTQGWQEATQYLRSQLTPEQDVKYYKIHQNGEKTDIPVVLAWWDYGYWIVRDAHMPVICSPGGGVRKLTAKLLMSENTTEAIAKLRALNIKYIVIDSQTAVEKFYSVVQYAGLDLDEYYNIDKETGWVWRTRDYYGTLLTRLYIMNNETQMYWGGCLQFEDDAIRNRQIDGIDLVFQSSSQAFVEDGNMKWSEPEVKVFGVQ